MDHPVHSAEEVIELDLRVKSEGLDGVVHVLADNVVNILNRVVVVSHLGVVGVVKAEVGVFVASQVSYLPGIEGRRSLRSSAGLVQELAVVEVLRGLIADSGNGPVSNGKSSLGTVSEVELRPVVVIISTSSVVVRRVKSDP